MELQVDASEDGTDLTFRVYANGAVSDDGEASPEMTIKSPGEPVELTTCTSPTTCTQSNQFSSWLSATNFASALTSATPPWEPVENELSATLVIHMKGSSVGLFCNEWDCRGQIPLTLVDPSTPIAPGAYGRSFLSYPNMQYYQWDGEGIQSTGMSELVQATTTIGTINSVEDTSWKPLNGTNPSALQSTSARSFLAGALIGVAGGALVASIDLSVRWVVRQRRRRA